MENTPSSTRAVPGHHLQGGRAQEIRGCHASGAPAGYTAYDEGWALYAESLGPQLGLYKDPASRYAALTWEMVRAAAWSSTQACTPRAGRANRPSRISWTMPRWTGVRRDGGRSLHRRPGQALGYKLGELRDPGPCGRAEAALGPSFDIRRFHNALLDDGPLPLPLLGARVDEWIAAQKASDRPRARAGGAGASSGIGRR